MHGAFYGNRSIKDLILIELKKWELCIIECFSCENCTENRSSIFFLGGNGRGGVEILWS